jgi:hypothetical protein
VVDYEQQQLVRQSKIVSNDHPSCLAMEDSSLSQRFEMRNDTSPLSLSRDSGYQSQSTNNTSEQRSKDLFGSPYPGFGQPSSPKHQLYPVPQQLPRSNTVVHTAPPGLESPRNVIGGYHVELLQQQDVQSSSDLVPQYDATLQVELSFS